MLHLVPLYVGIRGARRVSDGAIQPSLTHRAPQAVGIAYAAGSASSRNRLRGGLRKNVPEFCSNDRKVRLNLTWSPFAPGVSPMCHLIRCLPLLLVLAFPE